MSKFNKSLPDGHVVLAIDSRYNDNDGATDWAIVWGGGEVYSVCIASGYVNLGKATADATKDQRADAVEWYVCNHKDYKTLVGCTVKLKGSRKAPNREPLLVLDFMDSFFDSRYYRRSPEMVKVEVSGKGVWVASSCVNEVVRVRPPYWA